MASPPLQKKEVVASFRHPEFQGVLKENFLRVQPHIFQKGRDRPRRNPRMCRSLLRGLRQPAWVGGGPQALERPGRSSQQRGKWFLHDPPAPPTAAGFGLPRLVSSRPISSSCTRSKEIVYEVRCLTLAASRFHNLRRPSPTPLLPVLKIISFSSLKPKCSKSAFCSIIFQLALFNMNDNTN